MESTFWGVVVKPGKAQPFVPPPIDAKLHLSQATLSMDAENGAKVGLACTIGEDGDEEVLLCTLREGGTESQSLDLVFDHYTEFNVKGNASVHLTGYYMPDFEEGETDSDEEESEEDEEDLLMDLSPEEAAALAEYQGRSGLPTKIMFRDVDDEDDEDDDEDSDDSDDEDDDEDMLGGDENNTIQIVELNDDGTEKTSSDEDDDEEEEDDDDEDEDDEDEGVVNVGGGPRVIEVGGPDRNEDKAEKTGRETTKRKAANEAKQGGTAAKKNKVIEKAAADGEEAAAPREQEEEPQASTGKKAKLGKNGTAASVLNTWHPAPTQEKKGKNGNGTQARTQPSDDATERGIPIRNGRPSIKKFDNGFIMEDTAMGPADGKVAKLGQKVAVRYRGTLAKNGKVFDETKGNKTFSFRLGVGEVIKGWDRGVVGMRVGDKRRLTVPPQMAYGSSGVRGAIPPNATLNFDVELVDVKGK